MAGPYDERVHEASDCPCVRWFAFLGPPSVS